MHPSQRIFRIRGGVDADHESKDEEERNKICIIMVPIQIYAYMATVPDVEVDEEDGMHVDEGSRTDLDSYANMPVVGCHAYIILGTG